MWPDLPQCQHVKAPRAAPPDGDFGRPPLGNDVRRPGVAAAAPNSIGALPEPPSPAYAPISPRAQANKDAAANVFGCCIKTATRTDVRSPLRYLSSTSPSQVSVTCNSTALNYAVYSDTVPVCLKAAHAFLALARASTGRQCSSSWRRISGHSRTVPGAYAATNARCHKAASPSIHVAANVALIVSSTRPNSAK